LPVNAKQIRELMELGIDGEKLLKVVMIFDVTERDAKRKAADRSARYRQRKRDEPSRDASVTERDDALLLTSLTSLTSLSSSVSSKKDSTEKESKEEKKVRARRKVSVTLRDDWGPSPSHFEAAARLGITVAKVYIKADDMRFWAKSTDARKADWDATFHGFLRRDAQQGTNGHGKSSRSGAKSCADAADDLLARIQGRGGEIDLEPTDYTDTGGREC